MRAGYALVSEEETNPNLALTINVQLGSSAILVWFFLQHSAQPEDATEAAKSGLLVTPILGCKARTALDWCHAWARLYYIGTMGQFFSFPLAGKTIRCYFFPIRFNQKEMVHQSTTCTAGTNNRSKRSRTNGTMGCQ